MKRLPVIVGLGGINPAGRVSFHHAYRRMVLDGLTPSLQARTYQSLAGLMGLEGPEREEVQAHIRDHTLIRRIELFDPDRIYVNRTARLHSTEPGTPFTFIMSKRYLPETVPTDWEVDVVNDSEVRITVPDRLDVLLPDNRSSRVSSAGQLPTGFNPGDRYQSRNHPRGLQLTVFGASDAVRSTGLDLNHLKDVVAPDQIAVYSGSCGGLVCVAGNDDFCGLQSQTSWPSVAGETYYIYVDGWNTNSGSFTLSISCSAPSSQK